MKLDIRGEEEPLAGAQKNLPLADGPDHGPHSNGENAARSAQNIARWRTYLPADCIDTMISMGWDRTT